MRVPGDVLREGCAILDPLMKAHGFALKRIESGKGSGGPFAATRYLNWRRELQLHYRYSLGLVTYHFRRTQIEHEWYMRAVVKKQGANRYPGFSDEPLDAFRGLAHDLENFASAFLNGDFEAFSRIVAAADNLKSLPGFARLP